MVKHFPIQTDEVAMLGCESLSTTKYLIVLYIEKLLIHNLFYFCIITVTSLLPPKFFFFLIHFLSSPPKQALSMLREPPRTF